MNIKRKAWKAVLSAVLIAALTAGMTPGVFAAAGDVQIDSTVTIPDVPEKTITFDGREIPPIVVSPTVFKLKAGETFASATDAADVKAAMVPDSLTVIADGISDPITDINPTIDLSGSDIVIKFDVTDDSLFKAITDTTKTYRVKLNYNDGAANYPSDVFEIPVTYKTIGSKITDLAWIGSNEGEFPVRTTSLVKMKANSQSETYPLVKEMFRYEGATPALNMNDVEIYGISVDSQITSSPEGMKTGNITVAMIPDTLTYQLSVAPNTTPGKYEIVARLHVTKLFKEPSLFHTFTVEVEAEDIPSANTITGFGTVATIETGRTITSPRYFDIPLTATMFAYSDGDITGFNLAKVQAAMNVTTNDAARFTAIITSDATNKPVVRVTATSSAAASATPYPVTVTMSLKTNVNTKAVLADLPVTVEATAVANSITGFGSVPTATAAKTVAPLGYFDIPLTSGMFAYSDNNSAAGFTMAKIVEAMNVTTNDASEFTAAVRTDENNKLVVRVTAGTGAPESTTAYPLTVTMTLRSNASNYRDLAKLNVTVKTPADSMITGFADTSVELGYTNGSVMRLVGENSGDSEITKAEAGELELEVLDYIDIKITPDMFKWEGTKPDGDFITKEQFDDATPDLTLVNPTGDGSKYASAALHFEASESFIRVTFDELTGSTTANISVTLGLRSGTVSETVLLKGDLDYQTVRVYNNDSVVSLGEGQAAIAVGGTLRNVELHLGFDVTVVTDLTVNRRTWVTATEGDYTTTDERVIEKYWDIEYVYTLTQNGLNRTRTNVYFDGWYGNGGYYRRDMSAELLNPPAPTPLGKIGERFEEILRSPVYLSQNRLNPRNISYYDANYMYVYRPVTANSQTLEYLGTTDYGVPYSDKYYLASTRLPDVSSSGSSSSRASSGGSSYRPPSSSSGGPSAPLPSTGNPSGATPGGVYPTNPNFNPNNGR